MRIVIDLQGAQSGSRFRGIGRYSLSLAVAMARNAGSHEIHVVLNGRFGESIQPIQDAFGDLLPAERFHVWLPIREGMVSGEEGVDERLREAFIAALEPDFVHVSSLVEGLGEPAIISIGSGPQRLRTAVTLFDLIPLIYQKRYLDSPHMARWYHGKMAHLRRADLLLGISASAAQEAVDYLGFEPENVVNISSAIDGSFVKLPPESLDAPALRQKFALKRPFVMYTGGIDYRKNIEGLIRAYAKLPAEVRSAHQLAIVCSVRDDVRATLDRLARDCGLKSDDMILTGFVSDEDLVGLYNLARLFVFPSWHEGFGLPALEAMQCGAPVIGSNTSSLPEVIGLEEALFDPFDDDAIMRSMLQGLTDDAFRQRLIEHAPGQAARFSWDASAITAIDAMQQRLALPVAARRPRLAYVSPLPPERSGIADYSAELIPELARHYEIDVIIAQPGLDDAAVAGSARVRDLAWFQVHGAGYDRVLYHFGNSAFHVHMVEMLERVPGTVVLHDFFLSGMLAHRDIAMGKEGTWADALYRSHGYAPLPMLTDYKHEALRQEYPCNYPVLAAARGVIVHSSVSQRMAENYYPGADPVRWKEVPLMRATASFNSADAAAARSALELPADAFVVCSYGFMAPSKMNDRLLDAWLASPMAHDEKCYLIFVGEPYPGDYGDEIARKIQSSPAARRIRITGFATREDFRAYLLAADAAVQLRAQSRGETSAAVLDALNYGLATVVNANGAMADLPDQAVIKLPDAFEDAALTNALTALHDDAGLRGRLSAAGRALVRDVHQPRRCAADYARAIEDFYADQLGSFPSLLTSLGSYLAEGGAMVDERALGTSLAWAFPSAQSARQALVDIDTLDEEGREALKTLLRYPPRGWRVEPVTSGSDGLYCYARPYALTLLGCPGGMLPVEPVDAGQRDVRLIPRGDDLAANLAAQQLRWRGVRDMSWDSWMAEYVPVGHVTSGE